MRPTVIRRPQNVLVAIIAALVGALFIGLMLSCIVTIAIWPGELKLLAPLFCTDAQPDPFVVADTYSPRPGETVTNFTLYCMGPRGDATDQGFARPFLVITAIHTVLVLVLFALGGMGGARRRSARTTSSAEAPEPFEPGDGRSATPLGPGSTAGPFVD